MTRSAASSERRSQPLAEDWRGSVWLANLAIIVVAGFVAGAILGRSDFRDPRPLYNGWAQLAIVGVAVALAMAGAGYFRGRLLLRIQVAVLFSLLLHLVLVYYLHGKYLEVLAHQEAERQLEAIQEIGEEPALPDYQFNDQGEIVRNESLEAPAETELPDMAESTPREAPRSAEELLEREMSPSDEPELPPEAVSPAIPEPQSEPSPQTESALARTEPDPPPLDEPSATLPEIKTPAEADISADAKLERSERPTPIFDSSPLANSTEAPEVGPIPLEAAPPAPRADLPELTSTDLPRATSELPFEASEVPAPAQQPDPLEQSPREVPKVARAERFDRALPATNLLPGERGLTGPALASPSAAPSPVSDLPPSPNASPAESRSGVTDALAAQRQRALPAPTPELAVPAEAVPGANSAPRPTPSEAPRVATRSRPRADISGLGGPTFSTPGPSNSAPPAPSPTNITAPSAPAPPVGALARSERPSLQRNLELPGLNEQALPAPAFRQRQGEERRREAASRGGSAGSEKAVERGLEFLARMQLPDGRWSLHAFRPEQRTPDAAAGTIQADTAATGLALLSYLGAGYTHRDGKYRDNVRAGLDFLTRSQKADGDLFAGGDPYAWLYSHGIASIALCEAYGLTRDPALRGPAQRALGFIVSAQHPTLGGWRYVPRRETDTSVSGWQMMALKSGELAGLSVPRETYSRVNRWLETASRADSSAVHYAYMPSSERPHQRDPSRTMTAEALLMRLYLGWSRDDPRLALGAEYLQESLPRFGEPTERVRDAYYWYYATQVLLQVGGPPWEAWNGALRDLLVDAQIQEGPWAGSWHPTQPVPDRWGSQAGRVYVTAMHILMLEVYYRHLPLYQLAP